MTGRNAWQGEGQKGRYWLAAVACLAAGCATTFTPHRIEAQREIANLQTRSTGGVEVAAGILTNAQARQHFGVDLAARELQALWLSVRNDTDRQFWLIRNRIDPDFYSADEVAQLIEGDFRRDDRALLRQALRDESMRVQIPAHTKAEGYIYLPLAEGGRYVDVRLQADAFAESRAVPAGEGVSAASREPRELRFDFALRLPDGDFDYERMDSRRTYAGRELPDLSVAQLRGELERLPCCVSDDSATRTGDPLNIVFVGDAPDVLNVLTRSGWSFTHRLDVRTVRRMIGAAVSESAYLVAPVSSLYLFGRKQDVALQRARRNIAQRNHMRLWLAPFRVEGREVWVGQVSRDIGVKLTTKSPTLTTHVIDPQVDATREYVLHSLLTQELVQRFGFVTGSAAATPAQPRSNLTDDPFFSDGMRLVVFLSPQPVPADDVVNLGWEQSAAPIGEGQSEAARRNGGLVPLH